jgi:hypothetical protein
MLIKKYYDPAELLALQELDEVMKALKLNDEEVIEILLNQPTHLQQNLIQEWFNNFQQDCAMAEAEDKNN